MDGETKTTYDFDAAVRAWLMDTWRLRVNDPDVIRFLESRGHQADTEPHYPAACTRFVQVAIDGKMRTFRLKVDDVTAWEREQMEKSQAK